jgi:4-oxalocrotonate tautomerase
MPVVTVDWWKGNDRARRAELVSEVTSTLSRIAGCPEEAVTVLIRDVDPGHWGKGGALADTMVPAQSDEAAADSPGGRPSPSAGPATLTGNTSEHGRDVSRL